jgi:hypothetical protein
MCPPEFTRRSQQFGRKRAIRSMAQWEAKFDWPLDQFLRDRVQWPSEPREKSENGKLRRGSQLEFETLGMGREATSRPHPQDQRRDKDKSTAG